MCYRCSQSKVLKSTSAKSTGLSGSFHARTSISIKRGLCLVFASPDLEALVVYIFWSRGRP